MYEHLTGIQYLNFIGDIFQVPRQEREERIRHYGNLLELTPNLGDLISSYSHGMKQKTAIISAFLHQPRLLVLDEPFVGLDPKACLLYTSSVHEILHGLARIPVDHLILQIFCERIALLPMLNPEGHSDIAVRPL